MQTEISCLWDIPHPPKYTNKIIHSHLNSDKTDSCRHRIGRNEILALVLPISQFMDRHAQISKGTHIYTQVWLWEAKRWHLPLNWYQYLARKIFTLPFNQGELMVPRSVNCGHPLNQVPNPESKRGGSRQRGIDEWWKRENTHHSFKANIQWVQTS